MPQCVCLAVADGALRDAFAPGEVRRCGTVSQPEKHGGQMGAYPERRQSAAGSIKGAMMFRNRHEACAFTNYFSY